MSFFQSLNISATGLTAQRLRMDVISENVANVNTTRTADGGPYRRRTVLFQEQSPGSPFSSHLRDALNRQGIGKPFQGHGVRVSRIVTDTRPGPRVHDPSHPDANAEGYVMMPNVNVVTEMVNMISASRAYEANITAMNTTRTMLQRTLDIGSR